MEAEWLRSDCRIHSLRDEIFPAATDGLRVVVLVCGGGTNRMLTFLPDAWAGLMRSAFTQELESIERLICTRKPGSSLRTPPEGRNYGNRVPSEAFLCSCSIHARSLINAIEQTFGNRIKLVFGSNTMTVNRRPSGRLLRIDKVSEYISDLDPVVSAELGALLDLPSPQPGYRIDRTGHFRTALLSAVGRAVEPLPPVQVKLAAATKSV
jgi:hypothetical protein